MNRRKPVYRSTHPSRYFERGTVDKQQMTYDQPSWLERNGELITASIGGAVMLFAFASIAWALMASVLR